MPRRQARLMLFGEATSTLVPELINDVADVMREFFGEDMTIMVVIPEMGFAREAGDRVIYLDSG